MKNILLILLLSPFLAYAQPGVVIRNDTAFTFDPATGIYTQVTKQDTSALPRFTEKVKGLITWGNVQSKPSTYPAATHSHVIADITDFGSYLNISDSAAMLIKYLRKQDTANMLGPYVRANVAAATYQPLGTYATGSGSAAGTNTGDNAANTAYANDYRAANFIAGTNYLAVNGNGSGLTGLTASQVGLGNVNNTSDASKPVSTLQQAALDAKQASLGYTPLNPANNLSEVTAATARGNLGATTVGANIFTLANPSAIRFLRINADNTVTARTAAEILADIGAQASGSYLTANQTISFAPTGDVTGSSSNATSLTPVLSIGALKVTNGMLAGSIAASKLVGSDITLTESQITNLTSDLAAKQAALVSATNIKTVNGVSLLGSGDLGVSGAATTTYINLASFFSSTSVSEATVTGWSFAVTSGHAYRVEVIGLYQTAATTTGGELGFFLTASGAGTISGSAEGAIVNTAAATSLSQQISAIGAADAAGSNLITTGVSAGSTPHYIKSTVIFLCTVSGTFNVGWATEVAASAAQLNAGSALIYQVLN